MGNPIVKLVVEIFFNEGILIEQLNALEAIVQLSRGFEIGLN